MRQLHLACKRSGNREWAIRQVAAGDITATGGDILLMPSSIAFITGEFGNFEIDPETGDYITD